MIRSRKNMPLDYSLCSMTVTVYHREGLTRRVLEGVHYEYDRRLAQTGGMARGLTRFLLVIPGQDPIAPGDAVLPGIGPEITAWQQLDPVRLPGLGTVGSVKPRYFRGSICHTEARSGE